MSPFVSPCFPSYLQAGLGWAGSCRLVSFVSPCFPSYVLQAGFGWTIPAAWSLLFVFPCLPSYLPQTLGSFKIDGFVSTGSCCLVSLCLPLSPFMSAPGWVQLDRFPLVSTHMCFRLGSRGQFLPPCLPLSPLCVPLSLLPLARSRYPARCGSYALRALFPQSCALRALQLRALQLRALLMLPHTPAGLMPVAGWSLSPRLFPSDF